MNTTVVYQDSPHAAYLSHCDWGIDDPPPQPAYAPALPAQKHLSGGLKQFNLATEGAKKAKFQALFSAATNPRLSPPENNRFLERFRYVLCTSQLLNDHVSVSLYCRRLGEEPLFGDSGDWSVLAPNSTHAGKYWIGSGGCILVITLLIAWALRTRGNALHGKIRLIGSLVLSLTMALYLYARARRRNARLLRVRAISLASRLVQRCQAYDVVATKILRLIQEIELVARGYRLSIPLPPIARLDQQSRSRRCNGLRTALSSSLSLAIAALSRSNKSLLPYVSLFDLDKLYDIYNIPSETPDQADIYQDGTDLNSLAALKTLFYLMHSHRRQLVCSFLALDIGGHMESKQWTVAVIQLQIIGNLVGNLAEELARALVEDQRSLDLPVPDALPPVDSWSSQNRGLGVLTQTLQTVHAKMYILREDSKNAFQDSSQGSDMRNKLLKNYDAIGDDLETLLAEWKEGRAALEYELSPTLNPSSPQPSTVPALTMADSMEDDEDSRRNSMGDWGFRIATPTLSAPSPVAPFTSLMEGLDGFLEKRIYEATGGKSILSRRERIEKMQLERQSHESMREERQAGNNVVLELKDVLALRRQGRAL
ncbi:hypothetical protein NEOLI_003455 [Neolecta irregularis DAH-3]|uniref:Vezatin n=1 Tax=Neolecta irregularis (strain DAH-3) TaxID=1198029 RepID=A0A1U7LHY0_NEOID|nr:hypothetical protein NEOLI_003455 [Neolecta irregularis DAH-3]|eukprot:OLL22203.1 hypothetical protein NEOLI_003455 [Neolecta irregularis DAH-3]